MKMKIINKALVVLAVLISMVACDTMPDTDIEYTSTFPVSGEYYVTYNHNGFGDDPFGDGISKVYITNTSSDDGQEVWLSDYPANPDDYQFWQYKVKIPVNMASLEFGSTDTVINVAPSYDIKVVVQNGKVFKDASLQPSGVLTDSIYFELHLEDDDRYSPYTGLPAGADTLIVKGVRRTGFLEDEH